MNRSRFQGHDVEAVVPAVIRRAERSAFRAMAALRETDFGLVSEAEARCRRAPASYQFAVPF
jgi:hypothetical protein